MNSSSNSNWSDGGLIVAAGRQPRVVTERHEVRERGIESESAGLNQVSITSDGKFQYNYAG